MVVNWALEVSRDVVPGNFNNGPGFAPQSRTSHVFLNLLCLITFLMSGSLGRTLRRLHPFKPTNYPTTTTPKPNTFACAVNQVKNISIINKATKQHHQQRQPTDQAYFFYSTSLPKRPPNAHPSDCCAELSLSS